MTSQCEPHTAPARNTRAPAVVLVAGPPASGKTTLATALASALGYAIVDLDTVTGPLTRFALGLLGVDEDGIDAPAGAQLRRPRYDALLDVAAANLNTGIGVVLAAPFTDERSHPDRWEAIARRLLPSSPGEGAALLYLDAPADILRARLEARNAPRDGGKLLQPLVQMSPPRLVPGAIVLDGTRAVTEQLAAALEALASLGDRRANEPQGSSC